MSCSVTELVPENKAAAAAGGAGGGSGGGGDGGDAGTSGVAGTSGAAGGSGAAGPSGSAGSGQAAGTSGGGAPGTSGGPGPVASTSSGAGCRVRGSSNASANTPNSRGAQGAAGSSSGTPRPRQCCLCWCCCCSCCSTPSNRSEENGPSKSTTSTDQPAQVNEPPPTLEEIRNWGKSFDRLMRNPAGRKVFRDFLRCEYSEENILFWMACEELKKEKSPETVEEKARVIYEDYISILSPKEVSLDSRVREIVNRNMIEPTTQTFDDAQLQIYTLMHRDSYPRFVNSSLYKSLAKLTGIETEPTRTTNTDESDG